MAISLKNHEDRISVLENRKSKCLYTAIPNASNKAGVKAGVSYTFKNNYLKTAKYISLDYTTYDNASAATYHTSTIHLDHIRNIKSYYTQDTYLSDSSQGLKIEITDDTFTANSYCYLDGQPATSLVWITYLAIFEYYSNIVKEVVSWLSL